MCILLRIIHNKKCGKLFNEENVSKNSKLKCVIFYFYRYKIFVYVD